MSSEGDRLSGRPKVDATDENLKSPQNYFG